MKNSNDTIGNRTRNLPACSAVPQPTAPPSAPGRNVLLTNVMNSKYFSVWKSKNSFNRKYIGKDIVYCWFCAKQKPRFVLNSDTASRKFVGLTLRY